MKVSDPLFSVLPSVRKQAEVDSLIVKTGVYQSTGQPLELEDFLLREASPCQYDKLLQLQRQPAAGCCTPTLWKQM